MQGSLKTGKQRIEKARKLGKPLYMKSTGYAETRPLDSKFKQT